MSRISNLELFGNFIIKHIQRTNDNSPNIKELLKEFDNRNEEPSYKPGLMYINWRIARYYGFDSLLVIEKSSRKISEIRQLAYYISHHVFKYKDEDIAAFYDKNRTTIVNGKKHITDLINTDKRLKTDLENLTNILKNGEINERYHTARGFK